VSVAQFVPYREVVSEHNAYLALAGLSLAFGHAVAVGARSRPRLVAAVATLVLVLLGVRSHARSADWHDNMTLWQATLRTAPRSVRAQYNLGVALLADGDLLGARAALEQAIVLAPDDSDGLLALATVDGRLGEFDRAYELASRATEVRRDARSLTALGWAQLSRGNAQAALPIFDEAIRMGGETGDARRGLARARAGAGRF
jgi:tetratricopeptide (TPR) repeat protein